MYLYHFVISKARFKGVMGKVFYMPSLFLKINISGVSTWVVYDFFLHIHILFI